jgi:hypothetical protein
VVLLVLSREYAMLNATHLDIFPLVAGAIAGVLLTPVVAPVALGIFGFGAAGPIAGELL